MQAWKVTAPSTRGFAAAAFVAILGKHSLAGAGRASLLLLVGSLFLAGTVPSAQAEQPSVVSPAAGAGSAQRRLLLRIADRLPMPCRRPARSRRMPHSRAAAGPGRRGCRASACRRAPNTPPIRCACALPLPMARRACIPTRPGRLRSGRACRCSPVGGSLPSRRRPACSRKPPRPILRIRGRRWQCGWSRSSRRRWPCASVVTSLEQSQLALNTQLERIDALLRQQKAAEVDRLRVSVRLARVSRAPSRPAAGWRWCTRLWRC